MNEPTAADLARDLLADLALCASAPPPPWNRRDCPTTGDEQRYVAPPLWPGMPVLYSYCPPHDALTFACEAREGWPAAIRCALGARAGITSAIESMNAAIEARHTAEKQRYLTDHLLAVAKRDYQAEVDRLQAAIRRHRDYRGDHRCHLDDGELYAVLPEGDTRPARETAVTIENCARYIECRQQGREYVSPQVRIEELESEVQALVREVVALRQQVAGQQATIAGQRERLAMRAGS